MGSVTLDADLRDLAAARAGFPHVPRVAVVLGSGLGAVVEGLSSSVTVPYSSFPGAPAVPGVVGHSGRLVLGHLGDLPVAAFCGRFHTYQGLSSFETTWPVRLAAGLGASTLVLTNAAGAIDPAFARGQIAVISDHIDLLGDNPLSGWKGPEGGDPFVPMREAYDLELRELTLDVASGLGERVADAVYVSVSGPSYETPAEVAFLRGVGGQLVGMSTTPETIVARALGMRVLGLSLVTNAAAGKGLSHAEVLETGDAAEGRVRNLLLGILSRL